MTLKSFTGCRPVKCNQANICATFCNISACPCGPSAIAGLLATTIFNRCGMQSFWDSISFLLHLFRRAQIADRLIMTAIDVSERNWNGIFSCDALPYLESMLEHYGCKTAYKTTGYEGELSTSANRDGLGTECTREVIALTSS